MMMFLSMVFSYLQLVVLIVLLILLILGIVLLARLIRLTPSVSAVMHAYLEEKAAQRDQQAEPVPPMPSNASAQENQE